MADTAPAVVLDSPSSGARSNTRRKPETSRPAGDSANATKIVSRTCLLMQQQEQGSMMPNASQ